MSRDLDDLAGADRPALVQRWGSLLGGVPPRQISTSLMRRILAFEIQARALGGLSASTRNRLASLAEGSKRPRSKRLVPGGRLLREWNGVTHVIEVMEGSYFWQGKSYPSLSAIAYAITGAHWSGPRFFGLARGGRP